MKLHYKGLDYISERIYKRVKILNPIPLCPRIGPYKVI